MSKGLRLTDFYQLIRPTGPVFAFVVPWTIVLCGQMMALCRIIIPSYSSFYLIIIGNILTSLIGAFCLQTLIGYSGSFNRQEGETFQLSNHFKKVTYFFLCFILVMQLFQFVYFKGFPLLWLAMADGKNYMEYGISSLNGLLNAIYLLSTTAFYLIYLNEKSWKKFFILLLLFTYPVLVVSRQLFISLFLQIACCSLIFNPKRIKTFAFIAFCVLVLFVLLGNFRTGLSQLVQILEPEPFIPTWMYSLLWIYAYIVTPFNNINASIDHIQPIGMPHYELRSLLPSMFRSQLNFDTADSGFSLVHENMTVSSFYLSPLLDFGRVYAFIFMFIFQILLFLAFRKAIRTKAPIPIIEYAVLYMIMVLSIFDNLFLFLPVVAQLVLINLAKLRFVQQSGLWVVKWGNR
jgi:oligosaccharide repeat unit polymerase